MPYITVQTNLTVIKEKCDAIKEKLAVALADAFPGKTEEWLMLKMEDNITMYFAGTTAPCVMVNVDIFGKQSASGYDKMTSSVCEIISGVTGVPKNRMYVKYSEYDHWGWNGSNF